MPLLEVLGLVATTRMRSASVSAPVPTQPQDAPSGRPSASSDASPGRPDGAVPDVDKARFEAHWARIGARVDSLRSDIDSKKLGAVPNGALSEAMQDFSSQHFKLGKAREAGDYALASTLLDKAEAAIKACDAAFPAQNDKSKVAYETEKAKQGKTIERFDAALAGNKFGSPPHLLFADLVQNYGKGRAVMAEGERDANYLVANKGLFTVTSAPRVAKMGLDAIAEQWQKLQNPTRTIIAGADRGAFGSVDAKALKAAFGHASTAAPRAAANDECIVALDALDALTKATADFRNAAGSSLVAGGAKDPKAARAKAIAMLKDDPQVLEGLQALPGGKEVLDAMVGDLGGKASGADAKAFVRSAIKARFGPNLGDADLTTKYLPRLYKALGMVPPSHTKNNKMLQQINRTRTKVADSGDYLGGTINLEVPRTGLVDSLTSLGGAMMKGVLGGVGISRFDLLTLHEVGHAVDDDKQFMNGKTGNVTFGGWQKHQPGEVAAFVADAKGLYADFPKLPRPFLKAYIEAVLGKKDPEAAPVKSLLASGATADWKTLGKHAAVDCAKAIRLKSEDSGLWDGGDSSAGKHAIAGSVFQESYGGNWVSYALSARGAKISDYQFRAPGEWYAEAYSAYFVGKLKPAHPLHALLKGDVEAAKSAKRAAK
ncbi:MAG: hypothetical protein ABJA61_01550 [Caldimonas sp.]